MNSHDPDLYLAKTQALECVVIALCATMSEDASARAIRLLKHAEKSVNVDKKMIAKSL